MANRRMISADIFEDEFIERLTHTERLIWIGLFATVADDQGRMLDNGALLRSKIFPYDDIGIDEVESALVKLANGRKIIRYKKNNKDLIQIVKWWDYQTPSWASASKYDEPENWIDREKYHAKGNKIVTKNWDCIGGLSSQLPKQIDSSIEEVNVNGDVEVEGDGDVEVEKTYDDNDYDNQVYLKDLAITFTELTHREAKPEQFSELAKHGAKPSHMRQAFRECAEKNFVISKPSGMIEPTLNVLARNNGRTDKTNYRSYAEDA